MISDINQEERRMRSRLDTSQGAPINNQRTHREDPGGAKHGSSEGKYLSSPQHCQAWLDTKTKQIDAKYRISILHFYEHAFLILLLSKWEKQG